MRGVVRGVRVEVGGAAGVWEVVLVARGGRGRVYLGLGLLWWDGYG